MTLYAQNGFTDINNLTWNGCTECSSFDTCLSYWTIYCGNGYEYEAKMYDSSCYYYHNGYTSYSEVCGCSDFQSRASDAFINTATDSCDLLAPDIECGIDDVDCTKNCSTLNCAGEVISGGNATKFSVECGGYSSCKGTTVRHSLTIFQKCLV